MPTLTTNTPTVNHHSLSVIVERLFAVADILIKATDLGNDAMDAVNSQVTTDSDLSESEYLWLQKSGNSQTDV